MPNANLHEIPSLYVDQGDAHGLRSAAKVDVCRPSLKNIAKQDDWLIKAGRCIFMRHLSWASCATDEYINAVVALQHLPRKWG